jgi:hypothetical protein
MNAAEYWVLLVRERAWIPDQFAACLTDAWARLLLAKARVPKTDRPPLRIAPEVWMRSGPGPRSLT